MTNRAFDFLVCVYKHTDDWFLEAIEELGVGLELQSYGLGGVVSPESWAESVEKHLDILQRYSGPRAVHGPFLGLAYNYRDHLLNDAVRRRMDLTYELVRTLEPKTLVLHTNWRLDLSALGLDDLWLAETADFWKREIVRFEQAGVRVVLENLLEPTPDLICELCDRVDSDSFKLCLDVGHVNVWSALSASEWVQRMGDRLAHVHLHDNRGERDEHLPVGDGTLDFDSLFGALKRYSPDATISLEVEAELEDKLANLRDVLDRYGERSRSSLVL